MKKCLFTFGVAVAFATLTSCNKDDNNNSNGERERILLNKYPNAENIVWGKSNNNRYDVATFTLPITKTAVADTVEMWFGNNNDVRLVEEDIDFDKLPVPVQRAWSKAMCEPVGGISDNTLLGTLYSDETIWERDEISLLERDGVVSYKIEMEAEKNDDIEINLYYDMDGILVKEVEGEDDEEPLEIPQNVQEWVNAHFKDASIIDYEMEDDDEEKEHELDMKDGKTVVEVSLIEQAGELVVEEMEFNYISIDDLPADVIEMIEQVVADNNLVTIEEIDEIEMNYENGVQIFKIEFETSSDEEYILTITRAEDGTLTPSDIIKD